VQGLEYGFSFTVLGLRVQVFWCGILGCWFRDQDLR